MLGTLKRYIIALSAMRWHATDSNVKSKNLLFNNLKLVELVLSGVTVVMFRSAPADHLSSLYCMHERLE